MDKETTKSLEAYIGQHAGAIPADIKTEFCKVWPGVAEGLQSVEQILKLIPGAAIAIPFIDAAVSIGNTIQKKVCS